MQPHTKNGDTELDPDDFFAHTRMSLGDHLEELRGALWRALYGFFIGMIIGFFLAESALKLISRPVEKALNEFHRKRFEKRLKELENQEGAVAEANRTREIPLEFNAGDLREKGFQIDPKVSDDSTIKLKAGIKPVEHEVIMNDAKNALYAQNALKALSPTEAFVIWMKVAMYVGIVLSSPWVFYQIWMFIAAGLYPHEKKYVHRYLPLSLGLFLGGVALCEFVAMPLGLGALLEFNDWLGIEPDLRLTEWLSFAIMMPVVFGLAFQTPLVMLFLERLGIFDLEAYTSNRRIAIFLIVFIAALISVAPDPVSILILAIPMVLLYEFGIILCKISPRPAPIEEPDEELVEV
jgi:sec-independent protein translocase protein TatC